MSEWGRVKWRAGRQRSGIVMGLVQHWVGYGLGLGWRASVRDGMGWGGGVAGGEWAIGGGETRWVVCGG